MKQYLDSMKYILKNGVMQYDRTGIGTLSALGDLPQMVFDLKEGFPAVTTKKLAWKAMLSELLWFIEGSGDERRLAEILYGTRDTSKKTIWTANANAPYWKDKAKFEGDLGRVYGVQWRSWQGENGIKIDQLAKLIHNLKTNPADRGHILTAWNVAEFDQMALRPCHTFAQFFVNENTLTCKMYQRSADFFLGVPFNIASYALFTHMIAQVCGYQVGKYIHTFGDAHIYLNHIDAVKEQLKRQPHQLPTLWINPEIKDINDFTMKDFSLVDYKHDESIKAEMAV